MAPAPCVKETCRWLWQAIQDLPKIDVAGSDWTCAGNNQNHCLDYSTCADYLQGGCGCGQALDNTAGLTLYGASDAQCCSCATSTDGKDDVCPSLAAGGGACLGMPAAQPPPGMPTGMPTEVPRVRPSPAAPTCGGPPPMISPSACTLEGLSQLVSGGKCPTAAAGEHVPLSCPADCGIGFTAWWEQCGRTASYSPRLFGPALAASLADFNRKCSGVLADCGKGASGSGH